LLRRGEGGNDWTKAACHYHAGNSEGGKSVCRVSSHKVPSCYRFMIIRSRFCGGNEVEMT
jgi:hypothetical protein